MRPKTRPAAIAITLLLSTILLPMLAAPADAHNGLAHNEIFGVLKPAGNNDARTALNNAGYMECKTANPPDAHTWNCYNVIDSSDQKCSWFNSNHRMLYIAEHLDNQGIGYLAGCRPYFDAWVNNGGCFAMWAQDNIVAPWDVIPQGVYNPKNPDYVRALVPKPSTTNAGAAHIATMGVNLHSIHAHEYFTKRPAWLTQVLAVDYNDANKWLILSGTYGYGGGLISGLDPSAHSAAGDAQATKLVRQVGEYLEQCSCDHPVRHPFEDAHALAGIDPTLGPVLEDVLHGAEAEASLVEETLLDAPGALLPSVVPIAAPAGDQHYATSDGAVYRETNGQPGLQRFTVEGEVIGDERLA